MAKRLTSKTAASSRPCTKLMLPRTGGVKDALLRAPAGLVLDASEHGSMLVCGGAHGNLCNPLKIRKSLIIDKEE